MSKTDENHPKNTDKNPIMAEIRIFRVGSIRQSFAPLFGAFFCRQFVFFLTLFHTVQGDDCDQCVETATYEGNRLKKVCIDSNVTTDLLNFKEKSLTGVFYNAFDGLKNNKNIENLESIKVLDFSGNNFRVFRSQWLTKPSKLENLKVKKLQLLKSLTQKQLLNHDSDSSESEAWRQFDFKNSLNFSEKRELAFPGLQKLFLYNQTSLMDCSEKDWKIVNKERRAYRNSTDKKNYSEFENERSALI